jgi:pantoate--beta-alanine ligase
MTRRPTIKPKIAKTVPVLRRIVAGWRDKSETVALVPTMGALHAGHISLVHLARRRADRVVVSIFVNPAQFAPTEDFSTYPRTFATDVEMLGEEKADLVWAPANVAVMYPEGFATRIVPERAATAGLEDRFRPDFFKVSQPWSRSCSRRSRPTSRCSARRIFSSSGS